MRDLSRTVAATLTLLWLSPTPAATENNPSAGDFAAPAPPPGPIGVEEELEPEVTIIRRKDRVVEEYRVNGRVYMIKVTPTRGLPYFLVDSDGNGNFDIRRTGPDLEPRMLVPTWVLFKW